MVRRAPGRDTRGMSDRLSQIAAALDDLPQDPRRRWKLLARLAHDAGEADAPDALLERLAREIAPFEARYR